MPFRCPGSHTTQFATTVTARHLPGSGPFGRPIAILTTVNSTCSTAPEEEQQRVRSCKLQVKVAVTGYMTLCTVRPHAILKQN